MFLYLDFDKSAGKYYYFMFMCVAAAQKMLIDSLKFSREKQTQRGALPVAGFDRLRDSLFAAPANGKDGDACYELSGGADARDRPVLRLTVTARLPLQCQRCLKALAHELVIDTTLRLVPEAALEAEMSDDPNESDCVAASTELDVAALIEDEILLALPAYPRHEAGHCTAEGEVSTKKDSAFSVLSTLSTLSTFGNSHKPGTLKH